MPSFQTEASRWAAVQSRDPLADGKFVYSVKTTGIYCRPICKARLARRSNVKFHGDKDAAEADDFRPCLRCKPELEWYDPQYEVVSKACSTILASAAQGKKATLKHLAAEAGLTQSHFHRVFKSVLGLTPKTFSAGLPSSDRVMAEVTSSSYSSLVPFLDHSSSVRRGLPMPEVAPTPPAVVERQCASTKHAADPVSITKSIAGCSQSQIEYTIQPWNSGYVLIAATKDGLRAIDVGYSSFDLVAMMQKRFPFVDLLLSDWTRGIDTEDLRTSTDFIFASVMEALENPTGKVLHLPSNTFGEYR